LFQRKNNILLILLIFILCACKAKEPNDVFSGVEFVSNYDGDTITVNLKGLPEVFGKKIKVRLKGIDTPEINGKCETEKIMALEARDVVRRILSRARTINLKQVSRGKYFRLVAIVEADGLNLNDFLLQIGLAKPFSRHHKKTKWCANGLSRPLQIKRWPGLTAPQRLAKVGPSL